MQCRLQPSTAWARLTPPMASQPVPGARLLQALAVSVKYWQRVRCSTLPAVVAALRSWPEAPESRASARAG